MSCEKNKIKKRDGHSAADRAYSISFLFINPDPDYMDDPELF